ncbi:DUF6289 family protein [Sphaerisporangium fuscum]|uniref:DUF6289 family protein n=1 Tax=Sphaerisporangium fuscum TaxID=2835868 RepID=UPI001BDD8530|nr:DUF6289 family protein [Sphaerisporangium fuscum]
MIRRVLAATALAAAAFVVIPAGTASARACQLDYRCVTTYYSDSSHTSIVGTKYEDCAGNVTWSGSRSGYPEFVETPC